jgi:superfamily II DNA or RNA helicase
LAQRISLRRWQQEALERLERLDPTSQPDFLTVATPGSGKTTFALTACVRALRARSAGRAVVVVPTEHLKHQWANAATELGLALEPDWASSDGALPADMHGVVVTYQQVASSPRALRPLARRAFAILDEVHHAAESRAWGDAIRFALDGASRRLCLSGTPFRSDQNVIPFVRYAGDLAEPDYEYGYAQALGDGRVVRPVFFPRIGGEMEWTGADGQSYAHGFQDVIGSVLASQRLRTALSEKNEWLPAVLVRANQQLTYLRRGDPRAGAMAIAMDQDHARSIARILRERVGVVPVVATSDEPDASERIAAFAKSDAPWIVAVRMVSEGVDIPRLRVGVYATHTLTELFFRQAVGRLVRWSGPQARQNAYVFIPDDSRLRQFANDIKRERRHNLRRSEREERELAPEPPPAESSEDAPAQLSLFSALSAVPTDADGRPLDPVAVHVHEEELDEDDAVALAEAEAEATLELPRIDRDFAPEPVPPERSLLPLHALDLALAGRPAPPRQRKQLRAANTEQARTLARRAGLTHAEVNAELNRRCGIRRVSEATAAQLERRLQIAEAWFEHLSARLTGPKIRSSS